VREAEHYRKTSLQVKKEMFAIPVIDLMKGKVVRLLKGEPPRREVL